MDIHSQLIETSTCELAKRIIDTDRCAVKAITFEILEEFIENHGSTAIIHELNKLNHSFNIYEPGTITN